MKIPLFHHWRSNRLFNLCGFIGRKSAYYSPIFTQNIKIETPNILDEKKSLKVNVNLFNPKINLVRFFNCKVEDIMVKYYLPQNSKLLEEICFEIDKLENIKLWDIDNLYCTLDIWVETPYGIDNLSGVLVLDQQNLPKCFLNGNH